MLFAYKTITLLYKSCPHYPSPRQTATCRTPAAPYLPQTPKSLQGTSVHTVAHLRNTAVLVAQRVSMNTAIRRRPTTAARSAKETTGIRHIDSNAGSLSTAGNSSELALWSNGRSTRAIRLSGTTELLKSRSWSRRTRATTQNCYCSATRSTMALIFQLSRKSSFKKSATSRLCW
jgi:hypothetical protein